MMGTDTRAETVTERLALQIESLQEAFRKLSRAATVRDMAGQFSAVVSTFFGGADIGISTRDASKGDWQTLSGEADHGILTSLSSGRSATTYSRDDGGQRLHLVHRLVDQSHIGITLQGGNEKFSDVDVISLRLFVTLFDNAYQELITRRNEKELIFSLNHRVLQLNSLIDTGIEVSKLKQETTPHHLALERAAAVTNASKGVVRITSGDRVLETVAFPHDGSPEVAQGGTQKIASSFTFAEHTYTFELFDKESRTGVIPFEGTDQLLLDALSRQVLASLENRYLHQQALEKQRIEQDIAVAASIQQRILPAALPSIAGYDIAGTNIPTKSVGGDYYDCIPLPDGRYALIIADVAGKGIPAALLVSSFNAYLSAYLEGSLPLVDLVGRLNKVIARASTDDKFITAFFAVLDPLSGQVEAVNAGHNPILLLRNDGTLQELSKGGIPLGMLDIDFTYQGESVVLGTGDRVLLYTDGVTEATNEAYELYDSKVPLRQFLLEHKEDGAEAFIQDLLTDLKSFTGNAPQSDDITVMVLVRR